MDNLARIIPPAPAFEPASGHVLRVDGGAFVVRVRSVELRCARAASCLLEPAVGDRVVAWSEGAEAWVLAVLERAPETACDVVLEGDARVRSRDGAVTVSAPGGVRVESPTEVRLASAKVRVIAEGLDLAAQRVLAVGRAVEAEVAEVRTHAKRVDQVIGSLTQRVKTALRMVDDLDAVRAARMDYRAEQVMNLHGESAVMTGETVVKVDAGQIQLG